MNKPDRALTVPDEDEQLLDLLAQKVSTQLRSEYEVVDEGDGSSLDLRAIWSAVYRNRWLIAAVVAVALGLGVISILLSTPTYQAKTTVQVDQQSAKVLGTEDPDPVAQVQDADRFLQTEVDIVNSRELASRVANDLQLGGNAAFLKAMGAKPLPQGASPNKVKEQTLSVLQNNLHVTLPANSRILAINIDSRDPSLAAEIANSFAENFITSNLQRKFDTTAYSRDFLQKQLASTKAKLEESERALIDYSRQAGLIDASNGASAPGDAGGSGPRSLTTSDLVQLNDAYSQARSERVQKQQRWEEAAKTPVMSLPEVLGNPTIQQLTQKRAEALAEYQQDLQRYKAGHPIVAQAQAQIGELDKQIASLAGSIRDSIRDQYVVAMRQEQALASNVGQLKGATLAEQDRSVRYNILKREVDTNRELYDGLLQRYKELSAEAGVATNNISVVDRADPPLVPITPQPLRNMALAGFAGLALAFLLVFARERFDDAVRAPEDVERKLDLPLLGVAPRVPDKLPFGEVMDDPRSALSEAYQAVRSSIELSSADGIPQTLLITSSRQSEGKSTTAFALARDLAETGQRILLVDADLRKPSLHRLASVKNVVGLSNLLARQKSIEEVVQNTSIPGLQILPSGPLPPSPAQLLASKLLPELLAALSDRYDAVIVDGPPVLGLADAPRIASAVEGVVFVMEASRAHHGQAKSALRRLLRSRARLMGAVLTKFDPKKNGYGNEYGYYSYQYSEKLDKPREPRRWLSHQPAA